MRDDDSSKAEHAKSGQWDEGDQDEGGQGQVLSHDPSGSLSVVERVGEVIEALAHEGHVGGLDGDVAAHRSHGDADAGGGERRRVVDAITNHGSRSVLPLERIDDGHLVLGEQPGVDLLKVDLGCKRRRGPLVVAGKHDDAANSQRAQSLDDPRDLRTEFVADRDDPEQAPIVLDRAHRGAFLLE